ncbi:hypothetical protein [Fusobacterium pseudoperiodonticum]|uniref:hypothetical protein n=1 Tax=Fusobacterium pseudoperiodonticum TaxID=2663009 RepID=UPI000C1C14BB|nr:hypothetical protein [Fusobacterium pseudoperiodonticum]ATV68595.1 hypothetical protein CTM92_08410 [Fusobacterium pseudoperiodonticum]
MKKILVLFLSLLALAFVACGKDKDMRDILDKEKISSEFNIVEENEKYFEFKDKDENRDIFRIFMYEKILNVDFKDPNKIDSLEEGYIEQGCDIIYKDKDTIMIGIFDPEVGYGYNIHNFDNSKTTLEIIVAIGSQDELSEKDLFEILKEAKSFIK